MITEPILRARSSPRGAVRSSLFCPRACERGAGLGCLPGGARKACAPYGHSQKQPCYAQPLFHLHTLFCAVASRYGARISPVEHAERAPPMGTRKNALHRWCSSALFILPTRVRARRGVGMFARWSTQGVRPRSALAKAAVLCTASFSFAHTVLRGGVDSVHK